MPTALERYSLETWSSKDTWAEVYAKPDGSFIVEHFYPETVDFEIEAQIVFRGDNVTKCVEAIANALGREKL
jgi:hypothetical protein